MSRLFTKRRNSGNVLPDYIYPRFFKIKLTFYHCKTMDCDEVKSLHYYASQGIYLEVQSLVNKGVDLNLRDVEGLTPLMLAAKRNNRDVFELLIKSGADINCCDFRGWTLLHHASLGGSTETVQSLLDKGVAIDVEDSCGMTPLNLALQLSHIEVIKLLINSKADISYCDFNGWTLMHYASSIGWVDIVQCLVNTGVSLDMKDSDGATPLMLAAKESHKEVVELLIKSGADIHGGGGTLLHYASHKGWVDIVKYLVNKGISVNMKDPDGDTPLMIAARWMNKDVVKLLIKLGANIHLCNGAGSTVLHHATKMYPTNNRIHISIVQQLLKEGANINAQKSSGNTPLHSAIRVDAMRMADYLLKAGADCNLENNKGVSPFNFLISKVLTTYQKKRVTKTIKLCIESGAYVKSTDYTRLVKRRFLKRTILQDVKLCSQAVINKFNNRDLPLLYKKLPSAQKLPHIDKMKIRNGGGIALEIERAVTHEIQGKDFCNLSKIVPMVLGILCVKSFLEKSIPAINQANSASESQNGLKRLGDYNTQEYPCKIIRNQ